MRSIGIEFRKNMHPIFSLISCLGIVILCLLNVGYTTPSGKGYTILELLVSAKRSTLLTSAELNRYQIYQMAMNGYITLLLPMIVSLGYVYVTASEKSNGAIRFLLIREGKIKYSLSKTISAMLSSGCTLVLGYLILGIIIYLKFPAPSEYGVAPSFMSDLSELQLLAIRFVQMFIYGMRVSLIAIYTTIFFTDKYILMCLTVMLNYVIREVESRLWTTFVMRSEKITKFIDSIRMDAVIRVDGKIGTMSVWLVLLLMVPAVILTYISLSGDGRYALE